MKQEQPSFKHDRDADGKHRCDAVDDDCRWGFGTGDRQHAAMILRAARHAAGKKRDELTEIAAAMLPGSRPVLRLRVRSLLEVRDDEAAHALAVRGLLFWPDDVPLMQYRAQALIGLGRGDEAMNEIKRLLRIQPRHVAGLVTGGRIALGEKQHERAVMWLTRAHLCQPQSDRIKRLLAEAFVSAHQADAALEMINTMPNAMPLLRVRALRTLGRLCEAADVLRAVIDSPRQSAGEADRPDHAESPSDAAFDDLLTEALIVAELRGDTTEIKRLSRKLSRNTPGANLHAARIDLANGSFRRALRSAAPLMNDHAHGAASLAVIVTAAGMLQRHRLATRALRRLRERHGSADSPAMHECWRRAMLGGIVNDQRNPRRACADPTSSALQPLLKQAASTLSQHVRRRTAACATDDARRLKEQYQLCLDTLSLRSRAGRRSTGQADAELARTRSTV